MHSAIDIPDQMVSCSITKVIILATFCFHSAQGIAAGLVFSDGFEDGTTSKWQKAGQRNLCLVVERSIDGISPHTGKFMLECNWNGLVPWNDPAAFSTVILPSWPYRSEFLIRVWIRFESDVTPHNGSKILRLYPNDGKMDALSIQPSMGSPRRPIQFAWTLNHKRMPSFWGDGHTIGDGKWHRIEIYVKENQPGASDGVVRVWMDTSLLQELVNVVSIAPSDRWGALVLTSNWTNNPGWDHGANNHVNWDDIEIFSDLGTGATGNMSDATVTGGNPSQPNALHRVEAR
jgi:hypothetical protein